MRKTLILTILFYLASCQSGNIQKKAQQFIDQYTEKYQELYYKSAKAQWRANIRIIPGDTILKAKAKEAEEKLAQFTGKEKNIKKAQNFLDNKGQLTDLQVKQLEKILYEAASNPQTIKDTVGQKIQANVEQNSQLYGFTYTVHGDTVTTNEIDEWLRDTSDVQFRLDVWQSSKEVGKTLKDGLVNLRNLRNATVQELDYSDFFSYEVSEYNMSTHEMLSLMEKMVKQVWPLYRELHTFARYELAKKYGVDTVPDMLPAHWLPNRWGQTWSPMVNVEGLNLDSVLQTKSKEWIVKQSERFYVSAGFDSLPDVFWEKSSLYPPPEDAPYKKNNHASAWHLNLEDDVRCLMSVVPNADWYQTSHHELGHIYYYIAYTNPNVPLLLRDGANRAYHEAIGSLLGLAAMQKPYLQELNLVPKDAQANQKKQLLKDALNYIVFIPFSAGLMTHFEHALYAKNLPKDQFNQKWWNLKRKYQGIVPPSKRGEQYCDAASKTHINNDPAQYYDYAMSYLLIFQFHDYIANEILNQDVHSSNYYKKKKVGDFLRKLMRPGATKDWRKLLKETTGQGLTAKPMLEYFKPLRKYLEKVNKGREHTLPKEFKL